MVVLEHLQVLLAHLLVVPEVVEVEQTLAHQQQVEREQMAVEMVVEIMAHKLPVLLIQEVVAVGRVQEH
jgi:hypothetical protein